MTVTSNYTPLGWSHAGERAATHSIGHALLEAAKTVGLSRRELADKLDMSQDWVYHRLRGRQPWKMADLLFIAPLVGVEESTVFEMWQKIWQSHCDGGTLLEARWDGTQIVVQDM